MGILQMLVKIYYLLAVYIDSDLKNILFKIK
jgi:hypothetical protein